MLKKSDPVDIPRRTPATWTSDERVHSCFGCRQNFSFLVRKHHCRVCGRIFCSDCSNYKAKVPSFIRHFIATSVGQSEPSDEKRVCKDCHCATVVARNSRREIYVIANLPLDMTEIKKLAVLSKRWNGAMKTVNTIWNSIQYKLPHTRFSVLETAMLANRYHYLSGHSAWAIQTLKALHKIPHFTISNTKCKTLFCHSNCQQRLTVFDLLELYTHNHLHDKDVDRWAFHAWKTIPIIQHIHLMPWWVHIFRTKPHIATNVFIHIVKDNKQALFSLLFEMKLQAQSDSHSPVLWSTINKCLENIDPQLVEKWQESDKFLALLEKISSHDYVHRREREITDWMVLILKYDVWTRPVVNDRETKMVWKDVFANAWKANFV